MIKDWIQYNEKLARTNRLVSHGKPSEDAPTITRNSFFRGNDMLEADTAATWVRHSPFIVVGSLPGSVVGNITAPLRKSRSSVMFLATTDGSIDGIITAKELTFSVMMQFLAAYIADSEKRCCGAVINHLNYTSAAWQEIGPVLTRDYGWELIVDFTQKAPELIHNPSNWIDGND